MKTILSVTALTLAAFGLAVPAAAHDRGGRDYSAEDSNYGWDRGRQDSRYRDRDPYYGERYDRDDRYDRYDQRDYRRSAYAEPVYRSTRTWRGNDGRYYCRKRDGTTGLVIGAAAGALIGREVDKRGDRTLGTILGAAAGAIIGNELGKGSSCR